MLKTKLTFTVALKRLTYNRTCNHCTAQHRTSLHKISTTFFKHFHVYFEEVVITLPSIFSTATAFLLTVKNYDRFGATKPQTGKNQNTQQNILITQLNDN